MIDIKVFMPKTAILDPRKLTQIVENTLNDAANAIQNDFLRTTGNWKTKPEFKIDVFPGKRIIYTSNAIYRYVSGGTSVRRVVMVPGFRAKSRPGSLYSGRGRGGVLFGPSKKIHQKGIEPRNFDITIQKKWRKEFPVMMQKAIDTAYRG